MLELPTDFPRPGEQSYRGSYRERSIGAPATEKLRQLSRESGATLFMTLLAAFKALIGCYSGQDEILVGSPVSNRTRVELEPLIGFFVNMLVLRTDVTGDPTVRELIQRVRRTTLDALSHQDLPFEKLVREVRPQRSLSHSPFFQVALMFFQNGHHLLQLPGLAGETLPVSTDSAKYDLTLYATEGTDEVKLSLEYASDLFGSDTADRLLAHYECLLEDFVANPRRAHCGLESLAPGGQAATAFRVESDCGRVSAKQNCLRSLRRTGGSPPKRNCGRICRRTLDLPGTR